jgi:FAD/FMN-containing dehydrogenase
LREEVGSAVFGYGYTLTYDVSLSNESYYECVKATRELVDNSGLKDVDKMVTTGFGHIGDGNLHVNVSLPGYEDKEL